MKEGYLYLVVDDTCCHGFSIGELVECVKLETDDEGAKFEGANDFWWLDLDDIVEIGKI